MRILGLWVTACLALGCGKERPVAPAPTCVSARIPPARVRTPTRATFEGAVELLGAAFPERVTGGERFDMTLYYRVLAKPRLPYKVFVHFDGPGVRFQADHAPACPLARWEPGDYITDTFPVVADTSKDPVGRYLVFTGFFGRKGKKWLFAPVVGEATDADGRVRLGELRLE